VSISDELIIRMRFRGAGLLAKAMRFFSSEADRLKEDHFFFYEFYGISGIATYFGQFVIV